MNVTTEKIAKHTGLPENLIDDACEMNYNYKHSTSSNIFGHTNRMKEKELQEYEDILKHYRDLRNSLYIAEDEGRVEERINIARNLKSMGMSIYDISKATGLSEDDIAKL